MEIPLILQAKIISHSICYGKQYLMEELDAILASGAEGLILNNPESLYEIGSTKNIVKVKVTTRLLLSEIFSD